MLFSSPVFIFLFLPLCLITYYATGKSNLILLFFSLLFYAWGEPVLVFVMIWSIILNYILGLCIDRSGRYNDHLPKFFLVVGIIANLLLLTYYKYFNFVVSFINEITTVVSLPKIQEATIPMLLGVSFFTFQAMSYLIDVYRRDYRAQTNILNFALFKTLFPQLIAGPIVRYTEFGYQVNDRQHGWLIFSEGVEQFVIGLAKKILIADVVALSVDKIFMIPVTEMSASVAWTGTFLFALQIYFDFSGYTDMALGLGKMFGFRLPINFNYPYSAVSIQDFWRRWHMTLSRWFRDYLYIPLGGNRKGEFRTVCNLFIVFLLCGLWHGANLTFVLWGLLHGLFLAIEKTAFGHWMERWPRYLRHIYVMVFILVTWMIFRATSLEQVIGMGKAMFGFNGWSNSLFNLRLYADNLTLLSAVVGVIFSLPVFQWIYLKYFQESENKLTQKEILIFFAPVCRTLTYCFLLLVCFSFIGAQTHHAFIYFRF
jgi:alginate O-acetyltransferase complex protein AlgI